MNLYRIVRQINVHPSTVGREIKRNSTRSGHYGWRVAQESADIRKERLPGNRRIDGKVLKEVLSLLKTEDRSPMQISSFLSLKSAHISHGTIYKRIRGDESGELRAHCRHKMKYRCHVKVPRKAKARNIPGRTGIRDRPAGADGKRFGDWEMDLVIGKRQKSALPALCERSVNCLPMEAPHGKNPEKAAGMAVKLLFPYRKDVPAITTDNGSGFACHEKIARRLGTTVYFADSYASWQKEAVENANKLVRQYMPKGTDFREISDEFIRQIRYKINRRPREKLNFSSQKKKFFNLIA